MAGAKPITPPFDVHQVYGEVTAKISHTFFSKVLIAVNNTVRDFLKYGGNLKGKIDIIAPSTMHKKGKWIQNMHQIYAQCYHLA